MTLPYGVFLTLIFEHFDVNLEFETPSVIPPSLVIGKNQLSKMGYKEPQLQTLFADVKEARTKDRAERKSKAVEEVGEEEEEEEEEEDHCHIHVRDPREEEATSKRTRFEDIPGPSRPIPDVGEATATSIPSYPSLQVMFNQLQSNIFFRLYTMEAHWSLRYELLEAKVDTLTDVVHHVLGRPVPPLVFPRRPQSPPPYVPPPASPPHESPSLLVPPSDPCISSHFHFTKLL